MTPRGARRPARTLRRLAVPLPVALFLVVWTGAWAAVIGHEEGYRAGAEDVAARFLARLNAVERDFAESMGVCDRAVSEIPAILVTAVEGEPLTVRVVPPAVEPEAPWGMMP